VQLRACWKSVLSMSWQRRIEVIVVPGGDGWLPWSSVGKRLILTTLYHIDTVSIHIILA
jgi:hypothetical protein